MEETKTTMAKGTKGPPVKVLINLYSDEAATIKFAADKLTGGNVSELVRRFVRKELVTDDMPPMQAAG